MPRSRTLPHNFFDDAVPFKIEDVYCKLIPLTRGQFAIVWLPDYPEIAKHQWFAMRSRTGKNHAAVRWLKGKQTLIFMHREILGLSPEDPLTGDHVEPGTTLDNRRSNIRKANSTQQEWNKRRGARNTTGFKGTTFRKDLNKWGARIMVAGKNVHLGFYATPEAAHAAYCEAARCHFGEFARFK